MSDKDKGKGGKPFVADESELDAWDSMFDALHEETVVAETGEAPPLEPPMEWPKPPPAAHAQTTARVPEPELAAPEPSRTLDDSLDLLALDDQMSLDRAEPRPSAEWQAAAADESDFSDVAIERPEPEEEVFTSAPRAHSQPAAAPAKPIAPAPSSPVPTATPVRRTAAIIRRTPAAGVAAARPTQPPPIAPNDPSSDDFGPFSESTRVADLGEIEHQANQARSKATTAPPPMSFSTRMDAVAPPPEDDYEVEIGAHDDDASAAPKPIGPAPSQPVAPRRTVANVIRRSMPMQAVAPPRAISEVPIELDPPEAIPVAPATEDDFSDVAEAVGAADSAPLRPSQRVSVPEAKRALDDEEPEEDDEIDDYVPTSIQIEDDDPAGSGDAYVPMAPQISEEIALAEEPEPSPAVTLADSPRARSQPPTDPLQAFVSPPELQALYPRVKTPTSVPPMAAVSPSSTIPGMAEHLRPPPRLDTRPVGMPAEGEVEPTIDLEAIQFPEQVQPLTSSALDEDAAGALLVYERELATIDESSTSAALRVEAGRLSERLGDTDRARSHYDAALLADPRATAALRGLRRIARAGSDLVEATRQLDAEIAVAGALEKRPLGHYRVDLLLASGDQDLARVAVGEILDSAPSDTRALLAQLELAFLDGRAEDFGSALEHLAHAVTDHELRGAVQAARGLVATTRGDTEAAAQWFASAAESDPSSLGARLGAIRQAAATGDADASSRAYSELAQQVAETDPTTCAALALRAQHWRPSEAAAALAASVLPADPLVARLAAETTSKASQDPAAASAAFATWAACAAPPAERAYAAGRAAELDPARAAELWSSALQFDPGDDYAAAQLRTAYVAAEAMQLAIEVDLAVAGDPERDRARLRAAFGMIAQGQLEGAIELLEHGRAERPSSLALAEALAEGYAAAGRWSDRARLLAELAETPGEQLDRDIAELRSALAWEEAAGAAAESGDAEAQTRAATAALAACDKLLERASSPAAHAAAATLASRLGDRDVLDAVLARAQAAERSPWAASSIALRRARLLADDAARSEAVLRDAAPGLDDPRRTAAAIVGAARASDLGDAVVALVERADKVGDGEAAALRLRAAQLALDTGDAQRATTLLVRVGQALPGLTILGDLLSAARRRAGERAGSGPHLRPTDVQEAASGDAFARLVRDADAAAANNDGGGALALYQRALEMRPGDPLASVPLVRTATQLREPAPIAALALAQLRAAEAAGDHATKAEAYELLARIDKDLRDDAGSAQVALESASQADPSRVDLMHRLEREYTVSDQLGELLRLRRAELDQIPPELARDRAAMIMDTAVLAERDKRPEVELVDLYRAALACDPKRRLALLQLESIVRRAGASEELGKLEEQIALYFEGEARTQAAFYTRAGETLAELGKIDEAVQMFGKADAAHPGHVPALEGWRAAALKGQLWLDAAEAASRQAAVTNEADGRARLHHFAGVVLMDKALAGDQARTALARAIEADPSHKDAFVRLRILLEEDGRHDELALLLDKRLAHEQEPKAKIEIHRALAELCRNFLGQRDEAKRHFREILSADPNDLRAHAAIADIAWEQGAWQEAADALISRAKLERDPEILKTLCFRLGLIYADRLVDVPMALKAFQRALTYNPDDELTLVRLADLATQAGEWKLALGACERLVKNEQDPEKRAQHLSRVARIFRQGFGDMKRAERALNLALDGAPTSDDALSQLVAFYRESGDMTSVRVHLNRVAGTMRVRAANDPKDGVAYRVIARAMAARHAAGVGGSLPIARAAAELAELFGAAGDAERVLLGETARVDLAELLRPEADEVLFPRGVQGELRQMFKLLGDRLAKHVGVDLRAYGVGRGDRLRAKDSSVAAHAQDVATGLGFGEIDVYVSSRQPFAMVAEPTSPVSLVMGASIAQDGDARKVRFAAGAALKLAQAAMAIPARLPPEELGVIAIALVRLAQAEFPSGGLEEAAIAGQLQKLKRLIPSGLASELKPYALAIDAGSFDYRALARDLKIAGLRAGLVAGGSLLAGLSVLAAQAGTDVPSFLADPVAQGLISFALSEDHATVSRSM